MYILVLILELIVLGICSYILCLDLKKALICLKSIKESRRK